jgi:hypothetical protein
MEALSDITSPLRASLFSEVRMPSGERSKPGKSRMKVHIPAKLEPTYANFALITNSPSEIVIDLAQIMPQMPRAQVRARVVMTPHNAKLLHRALGEHLSRYEAQYGEIDIPEGTSLADQLFRGSAPESGED